MTQPINLADTGDLQTYILRFAETAQNRQELAGLATQVDIAEINITRLSALICNLSATIAMKITDLEGLQELAERVCHVFGFTCITSVLLQNLFPCSSLLSITKWGSLAVAGLTLPVVMMAAWEKRTCESLSREIQN